MKFHVWGCASICKAERACVQWEDDKVQYVRAEWAPQDRQELLASPSAQFAEKPIQTLREVAQIGGKIPGCSLPESSHSLNFHT